MTDKSEEVKPVAYNRSAERRAENLQILVALGVLGLSGTLYVQDYISFPLVESASKLDYVVLSFRWFVYSTVVFLALKIITVTLYPFSDSRSLIFLHDRVEPFLYVASPLFIILVFPFSWLFTQILNQPIILVVGLPVLIAVLAGLWFSSKYYNRQKLNRLQLQIIDKLFKSQIVSKEDAVDSDVFKSWFPKNQSDNIIRTAQKMAQNDHIPVEMTDGQIWISDPSEAYEYIR